MTPTKEQYELAAKFMGYHLVAIGIFNTAVVSARNKGEFPWEPIIPGKHAYDLLIKLLHKRYDYIELCDDLMAAIFAEDSAIVAEKAFLVAVELGRLMP